MIDLIGQSETGLVTRLAESSNGGVAMASYIERIVGHRVSAYELIVSFVSGSAVNKWIGLNQKGRVYDRIRRSFILVQVWATSVDRQESESTLFLVSFPASPKISHSRLHTPLGLPVE